MSNGALWATTGRAVDEARQIVGDVLEIGRGVDLCLPYAGEPPYEIGQAAARVDEGGILVQNAARAEPNRADFDDSVGLGR